MIKAGALYFSIVVAFLIALISASLIMLAAHYRNSYLKQSRYARLKQNLQSGISYVLATDPSINESTTIDLYGDGTDSVLISLTTWGLFARATVRSFVQQDTLKASFLIGLATDSTAVYLCDEDRPLSLSGTTKITGNVIVPKAGLKKAYADGKPYIGEKLVYNGQSSHSNRTLSPVDSSHLKVIDMEFSAQDGLVAAFNQDLNVSFLSPVKKIRLSRKATLAHLSLSGNLILLADSTVHIPASAKLNGIQLYAKTIVVEEGFKGNCQLFATDSIVVGKNASFGYPSVIGLISSGIPQALTAIKLGSGVELNGILFAYQQPRSATQPMISIGGKSLVQGEIYCTGLLKLDRNVTLNAKVSCKRFIMQTPTTLYENLLIDVKINRLARSKYYLSSGLFGKSHSQEVLKWLN